MSEDKTSPESENVATTEKPWGEKNKWCIEIVLICLGLLVSGFLLYATWQAANAARDSVKTAEEATKIARASADSAKESISIAKKTLENQSRPVLFLSHAVDDKNALRFLGLTVSSIESNGCISRLQFDLNNAGHSVAFIRHLKIIFFDDKVPVGLYDSSNEQVFVLPERPLRKNLSIDPKKYCLRLGRWTFHLKLKYAPLYDRNQEYSYETKFEIINTPDNKPIVNVFIEK